MQQITHVDWKSNLKMLKRQALTFEFSSTDIKIRVRYITFNLSAFSIVRMKGMVIFIRRLYDFS